MPTDALVVALRELQGQDILVTLEADQLNILGQTFRPVFVGTLSHVDTGFITLDPVVIKIITAPFFQFPTPLSFPLEKVIGFTKFDRNTVFPLT
jgi:hypothetical protein